MLTQAQCKNAQPKAKVYKLADGKGLYLEVAPNGSRWWRFKYRFARKEKRLSLGVYPEVSLAQAREGRDELRKMLGKGIDPGEQRKLEKGRDPGVDANSFQAVAREWFETRSCNWAPGHSSKIIARLERDIFPWLGQRPMHQIEAPELLVVIRRIESRGVGETAHRALQNCSQVFRYGIATGRATRDVAADLRGTLVPVAENHFASVKKPSEVGALMRAIADYAGTPEVRVALRLASLTFVRPGELRHAEWAEFDLDGAQWRIPAEKMKMRVQHIVPLATQALAALHELKPITGSGRYLFPSARTLDRPMSENTVNAALRRLGYSKEDMTGHGFRSIASTLLHEMSWPHEAIERQLAHGDRNKVSAAYNYAQYLPDRRKMMQGWADYLDGLREAS